MANGLLWLQQKLDDHYGKVEYYEYYSWERVAVMYGIETVNGLDWHQIMSRQIMSAQMATGEFSTGPGTGRAHSSKLLSCAYALLFLKRGTKPLRYSMSVAEEN